MKKILISFIRNNHLEMQKKDNYKDLDITSVVEQNSINRIFLLTNKNREDSIDFKNWISKKLKLEVKAVTLEKGSEKYLMNKVESIIKYILLAEEGHAEFFYLPGKNTLQINLWEIVNKNIYKGKIIYPDKSNGESLNNNPADLAGKEIPQSKRITQTLTHPPSSKNSRREIPIYNDLKEKKIFTINAKQLPTTMNPLEKGEKAIEKGNNLLICGEEGTGKKTFASELLRMSGKPFSKINFRTINPTRLDEELSKITEIVSQKKFKTFLFLNVEVLPFYIQEQFTDLQHIQIITTMNISDKSELSKLNRKFYYQISSSVISLEPLRARKEDLQDLIGRIINKNHSHAVISDNAKEILRKHNWPGNLNELDSVISRACMETSSIITAEIIEDSLDTLENDLDQWQTSPLDKDFNLHNVLGDVAMHYIMLALELSGGKKSKAAQMLGFSNYQTLSNWIKKYKK